MRLRRTSALAVAATLAFTALAACSTSNQGSGSGANGVLNVGMPNGPQTENNNPFLNSSAASSLGYRRLIFEPLAMVNEVKVTEPFKPWLATGWEWSDNYTKLALTIRDGVTWSDGKPLTGEDVAFTFELLKNNPGLNIEGVPYGETTASGNQVTVAFPRPQFVNQKKIFEQFVVPKHIWSTYGNPSTETVKEPVGSGPFTLKSFTPQTVTLTARDTYWQDKPQVKEVRYTSYADNNAQTTALATGASEWSFVFIPNYQAVYTSKDPQHYKLWFPPVLGVHGLWFNTKSKPWDNPALRRAVNLVVNRDDIFMQGEAGYFYPKVDNITGIPTPAGESFIAPEFKDKVVTVDVDAAKKELTDNGFTFDGDKLKDPSGAPVTLKMTVPSGWSDYVTDLEIIKDNVSKIGIEATVDLQNADSWTKALDTGDFQAAMHWTNNGPTMYDIYQSIMDGALYKPIGQGGINGNYGRYESAEATKALQDYANAADEATRTEALHVLQRLHVKDMPVVITSAANGGGQYSTKNWVGWPDDSNPYGPVQPTLENALDVVMRLKPAA
ncbi:peptide/nickel transport system substrate-binding protein [Saccharothrix coeruleofusca]|uniref:ABC transporter substrate-binding protein n=1 Tax=Saccharothrix coeruleofusca TaxID=33919 RepID=UPI001AE448AA|nr:ABC transporter substrate-binding protein [Saccharothrix coeruleofusca]MBP2335155.1 peptide/nickel transport system substrate-binding protein [Saccharothrix coeruleofusca]